MIYRKLALNAFSLRLFSLMLLFVCRIASSQTPTGATEPIIGLDWPVHGDRTEFAKLHISVTYGYDLINVAQKQQYLRAHKDDPAVKSIVEMSGRTDEEMALWAVWPAMTPGGKEAYSKENDDLMSMHLISIAEEFPYLVKVDSDMARKVCVKAMNFNSRNDLVCKDEGALVEKAAEYGLTHIGVETEKFSNIYRPGFYHDIYYFPSLDDGLKTFIRCSEDENYPLDYDKNDTNAYCEQLFFIESLKSTARITYRRTHLKNWQAMQTAWITLVESFVDGHKHP